MIIIYHPVIIVKEYYYQHIRTMYVSSYVARVCFFMIKTTVYT